MILAHVFLILIILAVIRSLILRRNLIAPIGKRPYKGGWPLLVGIAAMYTLQATLVTYAPEKTTFQAFILAFSHIGLMALIFSNRHIPGVKIVLLGAALNALVVLANGGWMPVTPETDYFVHPDRPVPAAGFKPPNSKNVVLNYEDTNLWILSDIIRVTVPWRRTAISIGDVLLMIGGAQFIFQVKDEKKQRRKPGKRRTSQAVLS